MPTPTSRQNNPNPPSIVMIPIHFAKNSTMDETRRSRQSRREKEIVTNLGGPGEDGILAGRHFAYFPDSGHTIVDPSFLAFSKSARRSCFIAESCG